MHVHDRVPLSQPVSTALVNFSFEKEIHIDARQEDTGDKMVGHPKTEWQPMSSIHHHSFAETVDVPPAPAMTVKQELLLLPDPLSSSKVHVIQVIGSTTHPTKYIRIL